MIIPPQYKLAVLIAAAAAIAAGSAFATYKVEEWRWTAALAKQQEEANKLLLKEIAAAREDERKSATLNNETEKKNAQSLQLRNAELSRALAAGRLRDPGRREGSDCPAKETGPGTVSGNSGASGVELSAEAGEFLRRQFNTCDRVVDQFLGCQSYALELHSLCSK
jgi:hypothetical protein